MTKISILSLLSPLLISALVSTTTYASKTEKGLLPEVKANSTDENKNEENSLKSELMITKAETNAIASLEKILKKKAGTPEEADLLNRLAELHMRRAKSGRFFDLMERNKNGMKIESQAKKSLAQAVKIYDSVIVKHPKFRELDSVLFNDAFANLQLGNNEKAKVLYTRMINEHSKSSLMPDALLELGEIYYNQQKFDTAITYFKRIENYPKSKAYNYGVYKSAWCHYNMKQTDEGIKKLKQIVENNPADVKDARKYNLRKEAIRDLTLFVGETVEPQQLYSFFKDITTDEELGEVIINLSALYESHSRYKEISIFIKEFIDKNEQNPYVSKAFVKMIQTSETLKQRDQVIANMRKLSEHCSAQLTKDATCKDEFKKVSLEISKKWWEIWLKNKSHTEFSKLTETSFEILMENEDKAKPDFTSRYAYAELLFQLGKYEKASENYEIVSQEKTLDKQKMHDSLYGAIYSLDKLTEAKKNKKEEIAPSLERKQEALALRYIQEFPTAEHVEPLQFKLGFLAYQKQDTENALKYLSPIAKSSKKSELKTKSEDIILDIYNLKKDYKSILEFSKVASANSNDSKRKQSLAKLGEEASYSQMVIDSKDLKAQERIDKLLKFSNEFKNSNLSKDALWQSISLAYSNGLDISGADLSLKYIEKYPQDSKNKDALKEAIKAYTDAGYLKNAIQGLNQLSNLDKDKASQYSETICDLQRVNYQINEARACYTRMLKATNDSKKRTALIEKLIGSFDDRKTLSKNLKALDGVENLILRENIEPYSTQILISRAQAALEARNFSEAFSQSLKINSRPVDSDLRAEARLIQAAILEDEFIRQSVKSSEAKFSLVLAMKTEKLDKAYTAYTSTIKMTKDSGLIQRALEGIDRIYGHFIDAISNMPVPASLNAEEQTALRGELAKLVDPFKAKKAENSQRLAEVSKNTLKTAATDWKTLRREASVEPQVVFPEAKLLTNYLPSSLDFKQEKFNRLPANEKQCDTKKITAQSIGGCINVRNFSAAEGLALKLSSTKETRPLGLYYLSVVADQMKQPIKSLWLIEKALSQEPDVSYFQYQKGKVLYETDGPTAALTQFEKSEDLKRSSKEISVLSGLKSFSQKDYISATEDLKSLSEQEIAAMNLAPLHIEAFAQKGDYDKSIKLAEKYSKIAPSNADINLQLARIYEEFANGQVNSKKLAIEQYNVALKKSKVMDQQNWIKQKIAFLSEAK